MNTLNTINAIFKTLVISSSFEHKEYNREENICYVFNRKTKKRTQVTQMPTVEATEAQPQATVEAQASITLIRLYPAVIHSKASTKEHLKKLDAMEKARLENN